MKAAARVRYPLCASAAPDPDGQDGEPAAGDAQLAA